MTLTDVAELISTLSEGILILSCLPKAHSPFTHFKTHTITLISWTWTLLESWKDNVQDPGHLTLLVPDVTPIMDGDDGMPSYCPHPLSGTGPSCVLVGTGYITILGILLLYICTLYNQLTKLCHPCLIMGHWVKYCMGMRYMRKSNQTTTP